MKLQRKWKLIIYESRSGIQTRCFLQKSPNSLYCTTISFFFPQELQLLSENWWNMFYPVVIMVLLEQINILSFSLLSSVSLSSPCFSLMHTFISKDRYRSKYKVQKKLSICKLVQAPAWLLLWWHFCSLSNQPRKVVQMHIRSRDPCKEKERVRVRPTDSLWNQSWGIRAWGKIRGSPKVVAYEMTEIFLIMFSTCYGSTQKDPKWENSSLCCCTAKLNRIIKIWEGVIRMVSV